MEQAGSPQCLLGGEGLLFALRSTVATLWDESQIVVHSLVTGERRTLVHGGTDARYVPTGHLVYVRERTLFALPFDVANVEATPGAVPLVEDGVQAVTNSVAHYAVSGPMPRGSVRFVRTLMWCKTGFKSLRNACPRSKCRSEGWSPFLYRSASDTNATPIGSYWISPASRPACSVQRHIVRYYPNIRFTMKTAARMPAMSAMRHAGTVWRVSRIPTAP